LSRAALVEAKDRLRFHEHLGENGGGIWGLTMADVSGLPFKDDFFDLVICSEVLEHIPEDEGAASEIIRVLKTGHNLVVSVPRFLPERICWALSSEYRNSNNSQLAHTLLVAKMFGGTRSRRRRMGEPLPSLFVLGYHEKTETCPMDG
jgi:ubiquinone/menaquinone biosynthesis C-methylase UbiE